MARVVLRSGVLARTTQRSPGTGNHGRVEQHATGRTAPVVVVAHCLFFLFAFFGGMQDEKGFMYVYLGDGRVPCSRKIRGLFPSVMVVVGNRQESR